MNTKVAFTIAAIIVVLLVALFLLHPENAPVSTGTSTSNVIASSTTSASLTKPTHTQPPLAIKVGTTTLNNFPVSALFDSSSYVSTSTYPTVTGTANVPQVGVIINNSKNVGVVGTWDIPVTQGHWSYSCSVKLPPGSYTAIVFVGKTVTETAKLTVR